MAKYCTNCGKKLTARAAFCQNCGTKVESSEIPVSQQETIPPQPLQQQQAPPPIPQPDQQPVQPIGQQPIPIKPSKKTNKKIIGILGVIIIISVVVIVSVYLFVLKEDDTTPTDTYKTDIVGPWIMSYDYIQDKGADELGITWVFNSDGSLEIDPPIEDGINQYTITSEQICLSDELGVYYPVPLCYEYNFGSSKKTITLTDNGNPIWSFQRIV